MTIMILVITELLDSLDFLSFSHRAKFTIDRRKYEQIDTPSEECCHVEATEGIMIALFVKSQTTNR